jgi:hypothetical protein
VRQGGDSKFASPSKIRAPPSYQGLKVTRASESAAPIAMRIRRLAADKTNCGELQPGLIDPLEKQTMQTPAKPTELVCAAAAQRRHVKARDGSPGKVRKKRAPSPVGMTHCSSNSYVFHRPTTKISFPCDRYPLLRKSTTKTGVMEKSHPWRGGRLVRPVTKSLREPFSQPPATAKAAAKAPGARNSKSQRVSQRTRDEGAATTL